jgi:hypothetical protein
MAPRGPGRGVSALLLALIHRSAWKGYSPKFICSIVHISGPIGSETANRPAPAPAANPYMFWWCIKMRGYEWGAVSTTPRTWGCAGEG